MCSCGAELHHTPLLRASTDGAFRAAVHDTGVKSEKQPDHDVANLEPSLLCAGILETKQLISADIL